ncbi:acyltransferase family protein [Aquibium oceanicum]|uniref:Acyltransferase n=1 Tax=Aquibium oceanicum TaxID=1670800 RepID=A0A1L3SQ07_9HYPH|nr:acyltransferase family protein [Aquibium oceanicum]APH71489.1 hypothetical protein BSQ44_08985 [Aquibium oceanicum]
MTEFRPEIQGLRAIAVVLVVLFHVKAGFVGGGFVGVDVFFVISGFLITRKLVGEMDARGAIDIPLFLAGRMRRLFPALFATMLATFVGSYYLLSPDALQRFAAGAFHALLYVSNVLYWNESGYFDVAAYSKPDLHTWSLSVEEQFYWLWPLLLLLVRKRSRLGLFVLFSLVFWASLLLNYVFYWVPPRLIGTWTPLLWPFVQKADTAIFFLMPFRMFEFAIGALCFLASERYAPKAWPATALQVTGLAMIGAAAVFLTEGTRFPGVAALLPCGGTALVILGGDKSLTSIFLTNRATDWIGRASYSIYLVHWPVVVLYLAYVLEPRIDALEATGLFAASLILGYALHVAVEFPFWKRRYLPRTGPAAFSMLSLLCVLVLALPLTNAWVTGGWAWRFGPYGDRFNLEALTLEALRYEKTHVSGVRFDQGRKVLVIGDSHGRDLANGLHQVLPEDRYDVKWLPSLAICIQPTETDRPLSETCPQRWNLIRTSHLVVQADVIVLSFRWWVEGAEQADAMLLELKRLSKVPTVRLLVSGRVMEPAGFPESAMWKVKAGMSPSAINSQFPVSFSYVNRVDKSLMDAVRRANIPGAMFWTKLSSQCPDKKCRFIDERRNLLIRDSQHLTLTGARDMAQDLVRTFPGMFPQ